MNKTIFEVIDEVLEQLDDFLASSPILAELKNLVFKNMCDAGTDIACITGEIHVDERETAYSDLDIQLGNIISKIKDKGRNKLSDDLENKLTPIIDKLAEFHHVVHEYHSSMTTTSNSTMK